MIDDVFVSEECASSPAPYCGDGIKNGNEQCDGGISCNSNCTNKTS
ncbi:hypothetical protein KA037_05625 [Patescibacteria group bacterium]|nr:hypothetical protein [Patescibacteria group bacterium]MBP7842099.1 hypothetical protein [Patescibacteria group bacterium]